MALISLSGVRKAFGAFQALEEVTFTVGNSEKVALVGPNGSGKTTILRMIVGEQSPDTGRLDVLPGTSIGFMRQETELAGGGPLLEEVSNATGQIKEHERELRELETQIQQAQDDMDQLVLRYGEVQHEYERLGGFSFDAEVKAALTGLGLGPEHWEKPVSVLSGGQKTRAALARMLLQKPDLLLLDEPTNHLDIDACEWLEEFLQDFPGAVLVVSHDRYFLDKVVTKVVDLHHRCTVSYPGNYTAFARQKQERLDREMEEYEHQQEEVQKLEDFIRRYKANQKSRQARGRQKLLDRMQRKERPRQADLTMSLALKQGSSTGRVVFDARNLARNYNGIDLFRGVDLLVQTGDRIGLVGPNGAGKTTLLKILCGEVEPSAGSVTQGYGVEIGYFSQDIADLDDSNTVLDELLDYADLTPAEARNILARFLFRGDDVYKQVSALSGGERNRLVLARLMVAKPNVLMLDEPTNHLDIDSREALTHALKTFDGTIILTSHDRYLLNAIVGQIVEISTGQVRIFLGNYDEYADQVRALKPRVSSKKKKKPPSNRTGSPGKKKGPKPETFEREIEQMETRLLEVNELLADPCIYADHTRSSELLQEHQELTARIEELYGQLEEALDAQIG